MAEGPQLDALREAIAIEGEAQRRLLAGEADAAAAGFARAAARYRESWELAPPRSFGRLIGMLKAAVLAGDAVDVARYARSQIEQPGDSPPSCYALAIAALVLGDDERAVAEAAGMRAGGAAFDRTADAIEALVTRSRERFDAAVAAIVADFAARDAHLTGVPIADTALMLERLARPRGLQIAIASAP